MQMVAFPGPDMDDCEIVEYLGDGIYKIKYQIYGRGPWHDGIGKDYGLEYCGRLVKKR